MHKIFTIFCAILTAHAIPASYLEPGDMCVSIAGPSEIPCRPEHQCCFVAFDYSICYDGRKCPDQFLSENELCSGIAGPSPYPCWPGLQCCNLGPDNSVCMAKCPK